MKVEILGLNDLGGTELRYCEGAGIAPYIFVNLDVGAKVCFKGKEYYFSYQNGHSYKSNNYNCPSNLFDVYDDNGLLTKVDSWDDEDGDEALDIIERFDIDCTVEELRQLKNALDAATPHINDFRYTDDTNDYLYFDEEFAEIEEDDFRRDGGIIQKKEST